MDITVRGQKYMVCIPSARNPFSTMATINGSRVVVGILPWAPIELFDEIKAEWEKVLVARDKQPPPPHAYWTRPGGVLNDKVEVLIWGIPSSHRNKIYKVKCIGGDTWTCQCKGFSYRGDCRHIEHVKELRDYLVPQKILV